MKAVVAIAVVAIVLGFAAARSGTRDDPKPERSPHGEAVELILRTKADEVRAAEGSFAEKDKWWHDTVDRAWVVKRPFAPGVIDSTHLFDVSYRIDGKEVARWFVDTRKGTAQKIELPAAPPAANPTQPTER